MPCFVFIADVALRDHVFRNWAVFAVQVQVKCRKIVSQPDISCVVGPTRRSESRSRSARRYRYPRQYDAVGDEAEGARRIIEMPETVWMKWTPADAHWRLAEAPLLDFEAVVICFVGERSA